MGGLSLPAAPLRDPAALRPVQACERGSGAARFGPRAGRCNRAVENVEVVHHFSRARLNASPTRAGPGK